MSSITEQIMAATVTALIGAATVDDRVFRSRVLAITRGEVPCIVVLPGPEESTVFGRGVDENLLTVHVEVETRGDPFDSIADPVVVEVHRRLMTDPGIAAIVTQIRKTEKTPEAHEADLTAGCITIKYEMRYLTAATDLTVLV